jgi:hypothetical protein
MTTLPVSLDLDSATLERLAQRERETGQSQSELAQRYIEEGLRMERHPGIFFQDGPTGRRAVVRGAMDVWELVPTVLDAEDAEDLETAIARAAEWHGLSLEKVRAAMAYYTEFREEIDDRIERNRALARELEAAWRAERGLPAE